MKDDLSRQVKLNRIRVARARCVDAWMALWDVVDGDRARSAGVQVCVPIACSPANRDDSDAEVHPFLDRVFRRDEVLDVNWIAFDPRRGLLHGSQLWNPRETDRPPPPAHWKTVSADDHTAILQHKPLNSSYNRLPMPPDVVEDGLGDSIRDAHDVATAKPLGRFVARMGIPSRVLHLVQSFGVIADVDDPRFLPVVPYSSSGLTFLSWIAGNDSASNLDEAVVRERRVQAVLAMPCFTSDIKRRTLTSVVDRGEPLVEALAIKYGMSNSTMRIMGAESAAMDGMRLSRLESSIRFSSLTQLLDAMPRDTLRLLMQTLPRNNWNPLASLADRVFDGVQIPSLMALVGSRLRPGPDGTWDWLTQEEGDRWDHIRDVAEQMSRDLIWPAEAAVMPAAELVDGRNSEEGLRLVTAALLSMKPIRLAEVLDTHMAGALRRAAETSAAGDEDAIRWDVPAEPIVAPTGQVIRFLSNSWELAQEGEKMSHCVGDYTDACLSKRCAIMSMGQWRDGEWEPTSTVELRRADDGNGAISVVQHQGRGNSNPPGIDSQALERWMAGLETGETVFDERMVLPAQELTHIGHVLGKEWNTPEAGEARWDRWRRILNVRHHTAGEFLQHVVEATGLAGGEYEGQSQVLKLVQQVVGQDAAMAASRSPEAVPGSALVGV